MKHCMDFDTDITIRHGHFNTVNVKYIKHQHRYIFINGLSNMCKIAHVKITKNSNYLLKNNNYLFKSYTFNKKCTISHTNLLF
jgi:hypothetical protein